MNGRGMLAVASALSMLWTAPCMAANDGRFDGRTVEHRTGAFAGMGVKMALGSAREAKPVARLQLGMTRHEQIAGSGAPARMTFGKSALEMGLLAGKPMLFVGGQSTKAIKQRAQLSGGDSWIYVVGGLAVAGAAFLIFADDGTNSEPCIPGNC